MDEEKHERNTTEQKAELWISRNKIPFDLLGKKITRYVRLRLQEGIDVDVGIENILPILPYALEVDVKKHFCLPMLRKVSTS